MNEVLRSLAIYEELKRMREAQKEIERPRLYIEPPQAKEREEKSEEGERGVLHIGLRD